MRSKLLLLAMLCMTMSTSSAHDWFEGLKSPDGLKCCDYQDCWPVSHRYNLETHRLEVGIDGMWVPVDPATLVPTPSPDGSTYACFKRRWFGMQELLPFVRCVILPSDV
jgi:hypothetical protein